MARLRLFSDRNRPVHLGPYPLEMLRRGAAPHSVPDWLPLTFHRDDPCHLVNAMAEHQAMMDAIRDGMVNRARSEIPADPKLRAEHLKAFGYFSDASMVGCGPLRDAARLAQPVTNPGIKALRDALRTRQTKTLAAGIDMIMADLKESMEAPPASIDGHGHVLVFLVEYPRDPKPGEPGFGWIADAQAERASRSMRGFARWPARGWRRPGSGSASGSPPSPPIWSWRMTPRSPRFRNSPALPSPACIGSLAPAAPNRRARRIPSQSAASPMVHMRSKP